MAGRFITFEGGEGTGKSTQTRRLAQRLRSGGLEVVETREPGGSPFAERIRGLLLDPTAAEHSPLSQLLLFAAARTDHLETCIRPALARGAWVICDRFSDSTAVYQGYAGGVADSIIAQLEAIVVGETRPDLTLVLDLDPKVGLARAAGRAGHGSTTGTDIFERRDLAFHEQLREGFLRLAAGDTRRFVVIDASRDPEAITDAVWEAVKVRLLPGQT